MTDDEVKGLLEKAWGKVQAAVSGISGPGADGPLHWNRSAAWVRGLGQCFKDHYQGADIRVFWKDDESYSDGFSELNELLYDVCVCGTSTTPSRRKKVPLRYVNRCYWQVESELNQDDTTEIVKDMSKLVLGSGESKLFVASKKKGDLKWEQDILKMVSPIANCCSGNLYFCFIAHPKDWPSERANGSGMPSAHKWESGQWVSLVELCDS